MKKRYIFLSFVFISVLAIIMISTKEKIFSKEMFNDTLPYASLAQITAVTSMANKGTHDIGYEDLSEYCKKSISKNLFDHQFDQIIKFLTTTRLKDIFDKPYSHVRYLDYSLWPVRNFRATNPNLMFAEPLEHPTKHRHGFIEISPIGKTVIKNQKTIQKVIDIYLWNSGLKIRCVISADQKKFRIKSCGEYFKIER